MCACATALHLSLPFLFYFPSPFLQSPDCQHTHAHGGGRGGGGERKERRTCFRLNFSTISAPNVNDTPRSLSAHPLMLGSGSAHKTSHRRPVSGTSVGRKIRRICSMLFRSGDNPPCMQKILSSTCCRPQRARHADKQRQRAFCTRHTHQPTYHPNAARKHLRCLRPLARHTTPWLDQGV